MEIKTLLQSFGLSDIETNVYLKALQQEYATAGTIAKYTGIKRPTVYHALESLIEKGLVITAGTKVEKYKAQKPEQLVLILDRKQAELESLKKHIHKALPLFPTSDHQVGHMPYLEYFYGLENLKNLMEKILFSETKVIHTFGVPFKLMESEENDYIKNFLKRRANKGIINYSIWHDMPKDTTLMQIKKLHWHVRLAPEKFRGKNNVLITIIDDKVIFLNFVPEMFGFLVTNQSFSDSMRALWESVWEESTEIN